MDISQRRKGQGRIVDSGGISTGDFRSGSEPDSSSDDFKKARISSGCKFGPAYSLSRWVSIAWAFVLIVKYLPAELTLDSPHATIVPMLLAVCLAFFAFITFRLKYGRSYTYGVVESVKGTRIMVRIGYDLRSNIKPDLYLVRSLVRLKKGDNVKVGVERPTLGLRGAKVKTVLEKVS